MKRDSALIIGGGVHGLSCALNLAKRGVDVTVVEKLDDILKGTSSATHNRAHLGYHYPRSLATAKECLLGYNYFKEHFAECLHYTDSFYYLIEREGSKVTSSDYASFCHEAGLDYDLTWPSRNVLDYTHIEASFLVPEPCFNLPLFREKYKSIMKEYDVLFIGDFDLYSAVKTDETSYKLVDKMGKSITVPANVVINATYASTNNIQRIFSADEPAKKYLLQTTEVAVVECDDKIPALTVIDGPFITILPYVGHKNKYLVYDVIHSIYDVYEGYYYENPDIVDSNWSKMLEHGRKYFPFMDKLKYVESLYASRPIPVNSSSDDERETKIITHKSVDGLYSILEGKFISAPVMAEKLINKIYSNGHL